jgi:protein-S-isoprenylcysteine O-methyltransferase Ste14
MRLTLNDQMIERCLRVFSVLAGLIFVYRGFCQWRLTPGNLTLLLFMLGEMLTVMLLLCARIPAKRDWRPLSCLSTLVASYYFLAVSLVPGNALIPEYLTGSMQILGVLWALYAKGSLRRSFGLLPANRGVVTSGAYRHVRHPIYAGYFLSHMGFLLGNFHWQNLLIFLLLYACQIGRILREEALLANDPAYAAYLKLVRYRVIPGIF